MEALRSDRPPEYTAHDPDTIVLPSVPTHEFPSTGSPPVILPELKSLGLPKGSRPPPLQQVSPPPQWQNPQNLRLPPPTPNFTSPFSAALPSPMETDSVMSDNARMRAPSIVSLDDPETREAAETLSGLRNMDIQRIHKSKHAITPLTRDDTMSSPDPMVEDEPEPLLSLITSSHPWIGGTISGSLYAYNSTMHYSPAWVQSVLEKNLQAVATGLGSVSRVTGVESRVRQYLGDTPDRRMSKASSHKHQRERSVDQMDVERGYIISPAHSRQRSRTGSQASFDTLPAYDDENRAPDYEKQSAQLAVQQGSQAWSTRLVITTSGLGAALSENSLKSLKFCLGMLRMATDRLAEIMHALKTLITEYEQTVFGCSEQQQRRLSMTEQQEAASQAIADRIKGLGGIIMGILQEVTAYVSTYAGGALPENASALVRRQLMSVPQRWKFAEEKTSTPNEEKAGGEMVRTGQRWLVFAEQGCDMIAQVSLVLSGTVESAEKWLDTMGRRRESIVSGSEKTVT